MAFKLAFDLHLQFGSDLVLVSEVFSLTIHASIHPPSGVRPGSGGRSSNLSRKAQTSLPSYFVQLFWGNPEAFPAQRHSLPSMSGVFPEGLLPVRRVLNTSRGWNTGTGKVTKLDETSFPSTAGTSSDSPKMVH